MLKFAKFVSYGFRLMQQLKLLGNGEHPTNSSHNLHRPDLLVAPSRIQLSEVTDAIPKPNEAQPNTEAKKLKIQTAVELFIVFMKRNYPFILAELC